MIQVPNILRGVVFGFLLLWVSQVNKWLEEKGIGL